MKRSLAGALVLLLGLSPVAARCQRPITPASPAEQYQAIAGKFNGEGYALRQATTDAEREKIVARVEKMTLWLLDLARKYPGSPAAMDALIQAVNQEIWMENNTPHLRPGLDSPEARAIAILLRDHVRSEHADYACWRMSYGFSKECERFLRAVLESNPRRDVRAMACLRLAQFLNSRLQRLELLDERPDLALRYEGLFGKSTVDALRRQDRAAALREVETLFERAGREYGDVKLASGGTVGQKAASELYEMRHLAVGHAAPEIEGADQEGTRFKLSDYRGKVVLLYFWSEY